MSLVFFGYQLKPPPRLFQTSEFPTDYHNHKLCHHRSCKVAKVGDVFGSTLKDGTTRRFFSGKKTLADLADLSKEAKGTYIFIYTYL